MWTFFCYGAVDQLEPRPELRSFKEVQLCWREFESRLRHKVVRKMVEKNPIHTICSNSEIRARIANSNKYANINVALKFNANPFLLQSSEIRTHVCNTQSSSVVSQPRRINLGWMLFTLVIVWRLVCSTWLGRWLCLPIIYSFRFSNPVRLPLVLSSVISLITEVEPVETDER